MQTMKNASALLASFALLTIASGAEAATVYTGDVIQGKRVIGALDVNDLEPGTRVVQILHDSPKPECDGDGCAEPATDYVE